MGTPYGYHMSPNRVRTSMKRGTPPMTYNFWVYSIVESDPHRKARIYHELFLIANS